MRRLSLLIAAAFLVLTAEADAMIQIDRGIAGARIGSTQSEVKAALGNPSKQAKGTNDFGPWLRYTYGGGVTVFFQGREEVTSIETTGLGDRTSRGIGVGSTEAAVQSRVPKVRCETLSKMRSCHTNDFVPGKRVTDFFIKDGKVARVVVGIVID